VPSVEIALAILYALAGALVAAPLSLVPGLHIYTVAGMLVALSVRGRTGPWDGVPYVFVGLTTGYAILSTVTSVFLAVPDDASVFVVLPGQKYARQGRGYEAAVLIGTGSLLGIVLLGLVLAVAHPLLRTARGVVQPHLHWVLWAVIAWLLLSEWPKGADRAPAGWRRWWKAWRSLFAGLLTFVLSGLLGLVLFYRNPVSVEVAFQGLLPAFVGLFAVPWVVLNMVSRAEMPGQHVGTSVDAPAGMVAQGAVSGLMGGLFAAFFPAVTGGIGALIAGHATAQRDDRVFLISQGAGKSAYYVGGLLLLFVPGLRLSRGGMGAMLSSIWSAHTPGVFYLAIAAAVAAGAMGFLLLLPLARLAALLVGRISYRAISSASLGALVAIVWLTTGWPGLVVCAAATGIGMLPTLWGSRRANCMGVILLPLALGMVGWGSNAARLLGLIP
jgi:putative membrane protein